MFCLDVDRVVRLESSAMPGIGGVIRELLFIFSRTGEGCGSAISTSEGYGRTPKDAFLETLGRH